MAAAGLGFIAGFKSGFVELDLDPVRVRPIVSPEADLPDNRLNDAKADSKGRIWAGTMTMAEKQPDGSLYRLDLPGGALHKMDSGYIVCNGPALSPDERWLYHTDSMKRMIYRFPMREDGSLGPREDFIHFADDWGYPDGMTTDIDGYLWVGHWQGNRLTRFTPDGKRERSIALPASQITNVCFAGEKLDRMFVTSAARNKPEEADVLAALFEILDPGTLGLGARAVRVRNRPRPDRQQDLERRKPWCSPPCRRRSKATNHSALPCSNVTSKVSIPCGPPPFEDNGLQGAPGFDHRRHLGRLLPDDVRYSRHHLIVIGVGCPFSSDSI